MRPVPRANHRLAVLIFAAAAALGGYLTTHSDRLSVGQVHIATAAVKRSVPQLYRHDMVYGPSGLWRLSSPTFQAILETVLVPTDYRDLTLPFRALGGLAVFAYLCGMYALLYRQCRSWATATVVALMSACMVDTLGPWYWGVGSLASITPETLCLILLPPVAILYLRHETTWRIIGVFAFLGLLANVSLIVSTNAALVFWLTFLARRHDRSKGWPIAGTCVLAWLIMAGPAALYVLALRVQPPSGAPGASAATAYRVFRLADWDVLLPTLLHSLLQWMLWGGLIAVPALLVGLQIERFRVRDLHFWSTFILAGLLVALGGQGISQLIGVAANTVPPTVDFIQASALVMMGLYVLFAQGLTNLLRLVRKHRRIVQAGCAIGLAAWALPSDNLRVARHAMYQAAAWFRPADDQPLRVLQLRARDAQRAERRALADWARANTHPAAVFVCPDIEFRMRSRRAILCSADDVRLIYALWPGQLPAWRDLLVRQRRLLHPPSGQADLEAIRAWVRRLGEQRPYAGASQWYLILDAPRAPQAPSAGEEITSPRWGQHLKLYRLL